MSGIGIDLGTAFARVSRFSGGGVEPLFDWSGAPAIPAVVAFCGESPRVGRAALGHAVTHPRDTVASIKRWLGVDAASAEMEALASAAGLDVERDAAGPRIRAGGRAISPADVIALVVRHALEIAEARWGVVRPPVVAAAAAWLGQAGRDALRSGLCAAGCVVQGILSEGAAAAASFAAGAQRVLAIVDAGAGGVSGSLLSVSAAEIVELASFGDREVGGDDVDRAMARARYASFEARFGAVVPPDALRALLRDACEAVKRELVAQERASALLPLPSLPGEPPEALTLVFDRAELAPLLEGFTERVRAVAARVRDAASGLGSRIEGAYAAGGMARLSAVQAAVASGLGVDSVGLLPLDAVASGAARVAAALAGDAAWIHVVGAAERPGGQASGERRPLVPPPPPPGGAGGERSLASLAAAVRMKAEALHEERAKAGASPPPAATSRQTTTAPNRYTTPSRQTTPPGGQSAPSPPRQHTPHPQQSTPVPREHTPPPRHTTPPRGALESTPPPPAWSRSSAPPPSDGVRRPSEPFVGFDLASGRFVRPEGAAAIIRLPMTRPLAPEDVSPLAFPTLLVRGFGRRQVTGVLTLEHGREQAVVHVVGGRAYLHKPEHAALVHAFSWPEGTYAFEAKPVAPGNRPPRSMIQIACEGLRTLMRPMIPSELEAALGDLLDLSPVVRDERRVLLGKLALSGGEQRLIEYRLDGSVSGREIAAHGGAGKLTTLQLFILFVLFDVAAWVAPVPLAGQSLPEQLEQRARKMVAGNHFEALGVHWSTPPDEIERAYREACARLEPGTPWHDAAPETCARMRARLDEAYAVLVDPTKRMAHRMEAYPLDYESITDLMEKRAKALTMKGAEREAASDRTIARELSLASAGAKKNVIVIHELPPEPGDSKMPAGAPRSGAPGASSSSRPPPPAGKPRTTKPPSSR